MYKSLSIIIPIKNEEFYLKVSLSSLLKSVKKLKVVYKKLLIKIIVIDDGSSDNSFCILNEFKTLCNKIVFIRNTKSKGISECLNAAINDYPSDLIARFDADDICKEDRFLNQINFLTTNKDIDILGTNARLINETGDYIGFSSLPVFHKEIVKKLNINCPIFHPSVIFKFKVWQNLNGYDIDLSKAQDFEFWRRCREYGFKFHNLKTFDIDYRLKRKSNTLKTSNKYLIATIVISWKQKDFFLFLYSFIIYIKNVIFALGLYKPKSLRLNM